MRFFLFEHYLLNSSGNQKKKEIKIRDTKRKENELEINLFLFDIRDLSF